MYNLALKHFRTVDPWLHSATLGALPFEIFPTDKPFEKLCALIAPDVQTDNRLLNPMTIIETPLDILERTTGPRQGYLLKQVAVAVLSEQVAFESMVEMSNTEICVILTTAKVPAATARWFLIDALGRKDVLNLYDTEVVLGLKKLYSMDFSHHSHIDGFFLKHRPFRSYVSKVLKAIIKV